VAAALTAALTACLPPSAVKSRAASLARITAADSQAKAALAFESSIDPQTLDAAVVGVTPFAVADADSVFIALGYGLSDLMLGDLAVVKRLTVVDRLRTDAMLRELVYVQRAFVDTTRAPRVGRLLRAGRLVTGVLAPTPRKGQFAVGVRVVDSRSGRISDSLVASAGLKQVLDAEKALVLRTLDLLGVEPSPAERQQIAQYQTRDLSALIAYGVGIQAGTRGDYVAAREAFREATESDPGFAAARSRLAALPSSAGSDGLRQQVLALTGERVNGAAPTRVAEAADVGLSAVRDVVRLIITVRLP
jgi:TolB-like protein